MDDKHFAEITKAMGREITRRGALGRLAAGLAAAVAGSALLTGGLEAKKGGRKRGGAKKGRGAARGSRLRSESVESCAPACVTPDPGDPQPFPGGPPGDGCFRIGNDPGDAFPLPADGCVTYTNAECGCAVEFCVTPDDEGKPGVLSFHPAGEVGCTVAQVTVKGGPDGQLVYTFDPPAQCGEDLVSPNTPSGKPAAISHIDVCGVGCCDPLTCRDFECTNASQCDGCGGVLPPCACPSDDKACTTDTCVVPDGEVAGTCQYVQKDCSGEENACRTNCRCEEPNGNCVCDPVVCPERPGCVNTGCDPLAGCQYECRCKSCTIGYYSQNQCRWDTSGKLPCAADSAIGRKCFRTYGNTLKGLLTARGRDVICAQAAAAYLNSLLGDNNCVTGNISDICSATNEQLSAANEGFGNETCPLRGCGNG